jgi:hypothetical protein
VRTGAFITGALAAMTFAVFAAPAHAAYPGELGLIAFARVNCSSSPCVSDIYTISRFGTDETRITTLGDARYPVWSPDGQKLAFSHDGGIYTVDADGTGMQQVLDWNQEVGRITWSPDGTRLAAALGVCDQDECRTDIHTLDATGGNVVNITPGFLGEFDPAWSPNGSRIAFDSISNAGRRIHSINPDGSGEIEISGGPYDYWPTWLPDSSRIAFATDQADLDAMNPDGSDRRRLGSGSEPAYSPDGEQIAFEGGGDIKRMSASGGTGVQVTQTSLSEREADWQPAADGTTIVGNYARPKGATPMFTYFVPSFIDCAPGTETRVHGPPLAYPSCAPPDPASVDLTIGSADSNGKATRAVAAMRMDVFPGDPISPGDEADVGLQLGVTHVYRRSDMSEYTGEVELRFDVRITDRENVPAAGNDGGGTVADIPMEFTAQCAATANPALGGQCGIDTSLDTLVPGTVKERLRSVWQMSQLRIYDGGPDGVASTEDGNQLFQVQGLFVP